MPRPGGDLNGKALTTVSLRLPAVYVEAMDREAAARGLTRTDLIRRLVERAGLVPDPKDK